MSLSSLSALTISEIVGDFGFKGVARIGDLKSWFIGISGYICTIYFLIKNLKIGNVIYINGMWNGFTTIFETAAAYFILGEQLNTKYQWFGLGYIVIGIFLLQRDGIPY